ncbi:D-glycero-beta-D-manno-heptose 1,7-bisphosphate 7-phosphatase [Aestuariibacter sp. AA17]|uniref:D,D-heptose 1,7-bisphosphate phosphatase n=1 Tax=Fluctibacter corallii TaxID=2984329 RepID=A0ABT3A983_9ALTE|nr:D-glycero-beta-D-manno-heptose 1,7-bisphosphate 7-phosphatase [Aestuariibacter sp. AA17]MCV2885240.1 D-glycero-beta-D-manno-heptose 1,7-bisphosphate 7-phosphatase [Aestuariibacter sp. AA17]
MNKALLLDRDGVINIDHGYTYQIDKFDFVPGIFDVAKRFYQAGYTIAIVTNQSGIARGMYSEDDFNHLMNWVKAQFQHHGVTIHAVYFCPHHPEYGIQKRCSCRKPAPGMLLKAKADFDLNLLQSVMIGDNVSDMEAAEAANVGRKIWFRQDDNFSPLSQEEINKLDIETATSLIDITVS